MKIRVYSHAACLAHDTGPGHAERPERLSVVLEALQAAPCEISLQEPPRATRGQLLRVHMPSLLSQILDAHPSDRTMLDPDTVLSPASAEAVLRASGAGIAAVDDVFGGRSDRVFCAVRPPGHHATSDQAMGFCLFNHIAIATAHVLEQHHLERISIVDFDVHHGNGTQAIFEADPRVQYLSSHQMPLYPGTGLPEERGVGNILNVALPEGADSALFRAAWRDVLLPALDHFAPQLVLISAGFDAHRRDPLAQLNVETDDYAWLTAQLCDIAVRHCHGRVISMLEGGYDLQALRDCVTVHVQALSSSSLSV